MKVVTLVTTVKLDKDGNSVNTPPGLVDLDDETAKAMIARGQAKTVEDAKAEAAAESAGPTVKNVGKTKA